jgi:hypothetical protein
VACSPQEISLTQAEFEASAKLGVVKVSGDTEVELTFPEGFMDDEIRGRVSLVNDGSVAASVSQVATSCGCTTAIPIEKSVAAGKYGILLMNYSPKAVGEAKVEASFRFGDKEFHLSGVAKTKPRFQQPVASLTFDESGKIEVRLEKKVATKVDRFVVFPPTMKLENFKDSDVFVSVTVLRDPDESHRELLISPAFGEKQYKQMHFELRYPGEIQVLPRRLIANQEKLRFFLRGDVESLAGVEKMQIKFGDKVQAVACQTTLVGGVLAVEFENPFEAGEYQTVMQLKDVSFSLPISAR